ncbi:MAG: type II secretion system inner membrane protein GspF [Gammaproteobacteria bacterium]|nr:type II secretion system inner membrane protein GspF [Gammaproteobacteria bacterium]
MPAFEYTALDPTGRQHKGVLEGDTPRQIRQLLRDKGWAPLSVEEVRQREQRTSTGFMVRRGVSSGDLALITRQLATLVRSGMPIEEALRAVSQQTEKPRLRSMSMAVRSRVLEGHSLATALSDFPHIFSELFRTTVEAGEHSGHLELVLERLADYTERRQQLQQKMMVALVYPIILSIVSVVIVTFMLAYVVPQVVQVFDHLGQKLPLITRIMIGLSNIVANYGLFILIVVAGSGFAFNYAMKQEPFRKRMHAQWTRLPLVGRFVRGTNTARFSRTFSILTASGVPVLEGMRISAQVMGNIPMREAVGEAARRVREGTPINTALEQSGYFPPMTIHLIASGEASGKLEELLERAAVAQEQEIETAITAMTSVFEPIMLLVMGGVVTLIVFSIMLPILDMNQLVK